MQRTRAKQKKLKEESENETKGKVKNMIRYAIEESFDRFGEKVSLIPVLEDEQPVIESSSTIKYLLKKVKALELNLEAEREASAIHKLEQIDIFLSRSVKSFESLKGALSRLSETNRDLSDRLSIVEPRVKFLDGLSPKVR